ncbi:MAG: hypothetical protein NVSMB17_00080 [Candidatus Dormibacteria bacterium]
MGSRRRVAVVGAIVVAATLAVALLLARGAPGRPAGVLVETSGAGLGRTPIFTVAGPFTFNYQFECSTAVARGGFGTTGSFDATIRDPGGADAFEGQEVFDQGSAGLNSRVYPSGGTYYVDIGSECNWHVSVVKGAHPARGAGK